jgi:hypothetical protein
LADELEAFGAPPEVVEAERRAAKADRSQIIEIWPENLPPFRLFLALSTQWRNGPTGPAGLDYGVIKTTARMEGLAANTETFQGVRLCEAEALAVWVEQRNRERRRKKWQRGP